MTLKILITGSNGQLGCCLSETLKKHNGIELHSLTHDQLDITNESSVNHVISQISPIIVINAAAYTDVDKAETFKQLAYSVNVLGSKYLAKACDTNGSIFINISSDYVFDGTKDTPYTESDPSSPLNVYGKTKLLGEFETLTNCPRSIIIRTSWIFSEHGHNFVKSILKIIQQKSKVSIVNDQFGAPTAAEHLATIILLICNRIMHDDKFSSWGIYNYSDFPSTTWYDFAKFFCNEATKQLVLTQPFYIQPILTSEFYSLAKRPINSRLNCDKIDFVFGIKQLDWRTNLLNLKMFINK